MRKNWKFSYLKNQDFFIHILYQDIQDIFLKKLVVLDKIHWTYDVSEYGTLRVKTSIKNISSEWYAKYWIHFDVNFG